MEMWGKESPDRERGFPLHCRKAPRLIERKEFIMGYLVKALNQIGLLITKSNQKVIQLALVMAEGMGSQVNRVWLEAPMENINLIDVQSSPRSDQ